MASIIKTSINLSEIPKDKIFVGKKGKYLPITITLNDEVDQFGNQGPVVVEQTKEERESKQAKPKVPKTGREQFTDKQRKKLGKEAQVSFENLSGNARELNLSSNNLV